MKLESIAVRNLRSLGVDPDTGAAFAFDLGTGLTVLVGPNNCGKSNVVRALELALDPSNEPEPFLDAWRLNRRDPIQIELAFTLDADVPRERRILDLIDGLPAASPPTAGVNAVLHRTQLAYVGDRYERIEDFGETVPDEGLQRQRLEKALQEFHAAIGMVVTRSGEPVESVLGGRFRRELTELVRSRFADGYQQAAQGRNEYLSKLDSTLFGPLTDWLTEDLQKVFPDVSGVKLQPSLPEIDEMIASLGLEVEDAVSTNLEHKGSGVRSGVVAALLRYLADHSDTSTVFAVEEPEAFLHPAAQEAIRDNLSRLADRPDMSVLLTTHSPFMVPREPDTTVVALDKNDDGRTVVTASLPGNAPLGTRLGGIFRDQRVSELLDVAARLPEDAGAVLVVEGPGDKVFIETAALVLDLEADLRDIHIQASSGVGQAVLEFAMIAAQTSKPVGVLLDTDAVGRSAFEKLRSKTFSKLVPEKTRIMSYGMLFNRKEYSVAVGVLEDGKEVKESRPIEYEAEDLFSHDFQRRFQESLDGDIDTYWEEIGPGITRLECARADAARFKSRFMDHVQEHLLPEDAELWGELIRRIRGALLPEARQET